MAILCIQGNRGDVAATLLHLQGQLRNGATLEHLDCDAVTEELENIRTCWQAQIAPLFHAN
jgi:hypothetical protein